MEENIKNVNENIEEEDNAPTVEELMADLAKERANSAKLKNSLDKASSEAADYKKRLRAKQTAEETEEESRKEAEAQKEARIKELEKQVALTNATNRYINIGMDSATALDVATKELEGDHDAVTDAFKKYMDGVVEKKQEEWLASRPQVNHGGDNKTEEELLRNAFFG